MINEDDFIFTQEDYEVFKVENRFKETTDIGNKRRNIQKKLLEINKQLSPELCKLGFELSTHYSSRNTTSLPYINATTPRLEGINWLGLRYGITTTKAKELGFPITGGKNKISSFLEHQCFQVNVVEWGVEIGLFHSNKTGTYDNAYITKQLENNNEDVIKNIVQVVKSLKYVPVKFYFGDKVFNPTTDKAEDFIQFYISNNELGTYKTCVAQFSRLDPCLLKDNFVNTCKYYINALYDLYNALSYRKEK